MKWMYKYLKDDLHDAVIEKLEKNGKELADNPKFDDKTLDLVEYGYDMPECGHHTGTVTVTYTDNIQETYNINYTIKRRMPDNGLDYAPYEPEYEVILNSLRKIKCEKVNKKTKLFLVCSRSGGVLEIVKGESFEEVYRDTIDSNNGEFLVELDNETINKLVQILIA